MKFWFFLFAPPLALVFSILGPMTSDLKGHVTSDLRAAGSWTVEAMVKATAAGPMISDLKGPVTSDLRAAGSWSVETDLRPELLAL